MIDAPILVAVWGLGIYLAVCVFEFVIWMLERKDGTQDESRAA